MSPAADQMSGLLRLVERHGADAAARMWLETLTVDELRMVASPFALTIARRMAADHIHPEGALDE